MSMEQVAQVLENTLSPDATVRDQATATLDQAKQADFGQLLATLSVVLSTETFSTNSRSAAGMYIKNSLSGRSQQFKDKALANWEAVEPKFRESVCCDLPSFSLFLFFSLLMFCVWMCGCVCVCR